MKQDFRAVYERRQRASFEDARLEAQAVVEAIDRITKSCSGRVEEASQHLAAGKLFEIANEIPSAETAYRRALAADRKQLEAQIRLIVVLIKQKRYEEAISAGNDLFLRSPDAVIESLVYRGPLSLCTVLGDAHRLAGDPATAAGFYREAARLEGGTPYAVNQAVLTMAAAGQGADIAAFTGKNKTFVGERVAALTRLAGQRDSGLAMVQQLARRLASVGSAESMSVSRLDLVTQPS